MCFFLVDLFVLFCQVCQQMDMSKLRLLDDEDSPMEVQSLWDEDEGNWSLRVCQRPTMQLSRLPTSSQLEEHQIILPVFSAAVNEDFPYVNVVVHGSMTCAQIVQQVSCPPLFPNTANTMLCSCII